MTDIVIRTGGSRDEGLGHIYRSIVLAKGLVDSGKHVSLWVDDSELVRLVTSGKGLLVILCKSDSDKTILSLNPSIIISDLPPQRSRDSISSICATNNIFHVAVDDIGLVRPEADLLINPSVVIPDDLPEAYISGGKYALIDESFVTVRRSEDNRVENVLISMGGSDPNNITELVLNALSTLDSQLSINVVIGLESVVESLSKKYSNVNIIHSSDNMPKLMTEADIAFLAGGVTLYEAAASGLPSIVIAQNSFQGMTATQFDKYGSSIYLGLYDFVKGADIVDAYRSLADNPQILNKMQTSTRQLIDGLGISRIVSLLNNLPCSSCH